MTHEFNHQPGVCESKHLGRIDLAATLRLEDMDDEAGRLTWNACAEVTLRFFLRLQFAAAQLI